MHAALEHEDLAEAGGLELVRRAARAPGSLRDDDMGVAAGR